MTRRTQDRYLGCLLGGAVGDALGAAVEFSSLMEIRARFGPRGLTDYAEAYGRQGAITDDTQMTLFTAEALLRAESRGLVRGICAPVDMARSAYLRWLHTQGFPYPEGAGERGWLVEQRGLHVERAPGNTCLSALRAGGRGRPGEPLNDSKGCGGVMRMAPVGLVAPGMLEPLVEGCAFAALTHGHPTGYLAAGLFARVVYELCQGRELREAVETSLVLLERYDPGHGETTDAVRRALTLADSSGGTAEEVESLGQGWVAEEALAIGLHCALVARDFEHGVLLAVNHGGDSDSTGCVAGNILGLIHGVSVIPTTWRFRLELRDVIEQLARDLWRRFGDGDGRPGEGVDLERYPPS